MRCNYCGTLNPQGEDRCTRCGRRWNGSNLTPVTGALAEKPKVIPFAVPTPKPAARAQSSSFDHSASLDFLPPTPLSPRRLKTKVEAAIYCDAPVAAPLHRICAAALDFSLIAIACAAFAVTVALAGGSLPLLSFWTLGVFAGIAVFYALVWVLANGETAGMRWAHLQLINFEGSRPYPKQRLLRAAGAALSFCSLSLGLLWALVDEEGLTWHDHMSRTFPTVRRPETNFFRSN
jgi:uncharacterized RDD family membrane protein YckC